MESKELSYILRHHPEEYGLTHDEYGWVVVKDLLKACHIKMKELDEIVESNTRFYYNASKTKIKAAHGHSYPIKLANEQVPPDVLYHGTAWVTYTTYIQKEGIKSMDRAYVHISENSDDARRIGSRHGHPVVLQLDTKQMTADGIKFYKSEDGVWLCEYVDPKYITIYCE